MTFNNIALESLEFGVQVLRISREKALNALNRETLREMKEAILHLQALSETRVLVITGAGEKAFVAGADIVEMSSLSVSEGVEFGTMGHEVMKLIHHFPSPTIAAVNGFALGGGTELAISCDFILANEKAQFGQPEVGLGIIPGFGGTFRLAKYVGFPMAKELIFSGRRVGASEAKEIGLVNQVYSEKEFWSKVIQFAQGIGKQSQSAVRKAKKLMIEFEEAVGLNFKIDAETMAFGGLFGSPDQKEGMSAFTEKRKPMFAGLL